MSLDGLRAVLQRQADADGKLSISARTVADAGLRAAADLDTTVTRSLVLREPPRLAFRGTVPAPGATTLTLTATGDLLGVRGASVAVAFTEQGDGTVDVQLVVALGASWLFGDFFAALKLRPFDALPLAGAVWAVTTAAQDSFAWNQRTIAARRGATVAGTIALSGALAVVAGLLRGAGAATTASLIGPVDPSRLDRPEAGAPRLALSAELPFGVAIPHFELSRPRVEVTTVERGRESYGAVAFATTLSIDGRPYGDFTASVGLTRLPTVGLAWVPDRAAPLSIETIARLLSGVDLDAAVPRPLAAIFRAVTLQGLFADLTVGRSVALTRIGATIGSSGPYDWGQFKLERISMGATVIDPFGTRMLLLSFSGAVRFFPDVFDGEFQVAVDGTADGQSLDVAAGYVGVLDFNRVVAGISRAAGNPLELPREWLSLQFEDFGVEFSKTAGESVEYLLYGAARAAFPIPFLNASAETAFQGTIDSATQAYKLAGSLRIADQFFEGSADIVRGDTTLTASWQALLESYLNLRDVLVAAGLPDPGIPRQFDLGLSAASMTYAVQQAVLVLQAHSVNYGDALLVALRSGGGWRFLAGVDVKRRLDLADLPLIDHLLPSGTTLAVDGIQALAYTAIDAEAKRAIERRLAGPYRPAVPESRGLGAQLSLQLDVAGSSIPFALSIGDSGRRRAAFGELPAPDDHPQRALIRGGAAERPPALRGEPLRGEVLEAQDEPSDGTVWFDVQQSFGPVAFEKVGVRYDGGVLWFLMNASISGGGLTIAVFGLGMGSPLESFRPRFTIRGLGLSFERDPVSISGALLGSLEPLEFAGLLSLKVRQLQIGAIGAYAEVENHPSFFLYAVLGAPLGGPPAFFVTGLSAGFGFNRRLVLPTVDRVEDFPFVQWAVGEGSPPPGNPSDTARAVRRVVGELQSGGFVAPSLGQHWLALGIRFRSFELLDTFALLTLSFGTEVEVGLIGLSTVQVPPAPAPAVAKAQLALVASFSPRSGLLAVSGQLTSQSYVLSPRARLTGGFAFWSWFSGRHAGDFVMTIGGYSPRWTPPQHYPQVPRVGLDWKVTDQLQITGSLYFALTSSAVMAGGGMSAVWQSGSVRAWFTVQADFLIVFQPFHYYISAGVQLGCSVRVNLLFTHVTINVHLGVGLEIWGPEFAGRATVDLSIVSFTISFGAGSKDTNTTVRWGEFVDALLPSAGDRRRASRASGLLGPAPLDAEQPPPAIVQIQVADGLLQQLSEREGELNWVVNGAKLKLTTQTAIPAKRIDLGDGIALAPGAARPNTDFGVGPTGTDPNAFRSDHKVSISGEQGARFHAEPLLRNVPKALWERRQFDRNGVPLGVDPVRRTTIDDVAVGTTLTGVGLEPEHTLPIPLRWLDYTTAPQVEPLVFPRPTAPSGDPFGRETVWDTVDASLARGNRDVLTDVAGRAGLAVPRPGAIDVRELTSRTTAGLQAPPQLRLLGEQR